VRTISIQELKQQLSEVVSAAEAGERFVITRHKKPVAELGATDSGALHVGRAFGTGLLRTVLDGPTRGQYLEVLRDDRATGD
jgi:antitoxin (DNA-binding transcriptional repressor) of toxin-antitoxin stability system